MIRAHVLICGGTGCTSSGSQSIQQAFVSELEKNGLTEEIKIVQTGCFGLCALGPVVIVHPEGTFYSRVTAEDVAEYFNNDGAAEIEALVKKFIPSYEKDESNYEIEVDVKVA